VATTITSSTALIPAYTQL